MTQKHTPPSIHSHSFSCAHCGTFAHQSWYDVFCMPLDTNETPRVNHNITPHCVETTLSIHSRIKLHNTNISICKACEEATVWFSDSIASPKSFHGFRPHNDMPPEVLPEFIEAANIFNDSPRGAAALLRLSLQKLCKTLGLDGKNINSDIATLVQRGLDQKIQQALDIVRVIGNEAVHPGTIDLNDNRDIASQLFNLVNFIVEEMITRPKTINALYETIPENSRHQIAKRDA